MATYVERLPEVEAFLYGVDDVPEWWDDIANRIGVTPLLEENGISFRIYAENHKARVGADYIVYDIANDFVYSMPKREFNRRYKPKEEQ